MARKKNKKNSRLGRGLGSLLGPTGDDSPSNQVANKIPLNENGILNDENEETEEIKADSSKTAKEVLKEEKSKKDEVSAKSKTEKDKLEDNKPETKAKEKVSTDKKAEAESAKSKKTEEKAEVTKATKSTPKVEAAISIDEKSEAKIEEPKIVEKVVEKVVVKEQKIPEGSRIWKIAVEKIIPNQFQPRQYFDKEKVEELSQSIKEQGILQPIVVRKTKDQKLEIISGERRWRAAQMAKLHEVPVIIKDVDDQNSLELALIENIQRANLNPLEEAEAYQRLADEFSLTQEQIAKKVGKNRASVANTLRLLGLSPEVRNFVKEGKLSQGHAKALLSIGDPIKQRELAKKIVNESLSVRAVETLAAQSNKPLKEKKENVASEISNRLASQQAQELQRLLGTKVKIDYTGGKGKIALQFYSDDQFNDIIDRLKEAWK
ncbi:MAG: ParB/RepB/Spo0J family partition protein [Bdellovibrionota bacterium]|nr:ParB/RepB/Spo0J family partition protein [Bdellovibrionota bacterium]